MKRTFTIIALVMLLGLVLLTACGGGARQGLTSHPSSANPGNSSSAPIISSGDDLDQQLNAVEQSLNDLETSLNNMPALPDIK